MYTPASSPSRTCRGSDVEALEPEDARQAAEMIRAAAGRRRLRIQGGGSKDAYGAPAPTDAQRLSTRRMVGIIDYDPQEFVLTAGAGIRLADVQALLASQGQQLAFEPPDLGPLFGAAPAQSTLGGVLAANLSGPRRILSGAARDHLLGFEAVSGRGVIFKSGGRVVKNVTGFDLSKLMCGAWGALALLTTVTVRTVATPQTSATLRVSGLSDDRVITALGAALRAPLQVSGAAGVSGAALVRLEGFNSSVEARARRLREILQPFGDPETLDGDEMIWPRIGNLQVLESRAAALWRLSLPPARGAEAIEALQAHNAERLFDWGGGLLWVRLAADRSLEIRAVAERLGGHATLVQADAPVGSLAFHPPGPALTALFARVRTAFDPDGVFVNRSVAA